MRENIRQLKEKSKNSYVVGPFLKMFIEIPGHAGFDFAILPVSMTVLKDLYRSMRNALRGSMDFSNDTTVNPGAAKIYNDCKDHARFFPAISRTGLTGAQKPHEA